MALWTPISFTHHSSRVVARFCTYLLSPPLECMFRIFRLYFPVFRLYLPVSQYPSILYYTLAILQHIHCIPLYYYIQLYPLYLACISLYPAIFAVSRCISYLITVSHHISPLRKRDITKNTLQGEANLATRRPKPKCRASRQRRPRHKIAIYYQLGLACHHFAALCIVYE